MSRFGPNPKAFFDSVYEQTPPWDVGGPQPALMEMIANSPPSSPILDVGCGSGDLAIALAESGYDVLGIDFVEPAIQQARAKASQASPDAARRARFQVGDALRPSLLGEPFGAVVDSGFLHLFEPEECDRFAEELSVVIRPGGRYYLLAFAVTFPIPNSPRDITEVELRGRFTVERGWKMLHLGAAEFQSRIAPVPAIRACIERS